MVGCSAVTLTTTDNGTPAAQVDLADPQGSVAATATIPATGNSTGIDTWTSYTEYGQPTTNTTTTPAAGGAAGIGYGWLGTHERATLPGLGLVLMGARLYNQTTGLFTSPDPIYGGNPTTYGYPTDPINNTDLNGTESRRNHWLRTAAEAATCTAMGVLRCARVALISRYADSLTSRIRDANESNAIRHFIWMALMTLQLGSYWSTMVGNSHEYLLNRSSIVPERLDSARDQRNNSLSRQWVTLHRSLAMVLAISSIGVAAARLYSIGRSLYSRNAFSRVYSWNGVPYVTMGWIN